MREIINYPCQTCSHSKINHIVPFMYSKPDRSCERLLMCGVKFCTCDEFKADNLKYLENQCDK
jgi:hypothetical protein